jgi:hypothetical protein
MTNKLVEAANRLRNSHNEMSPKEFRECCDLTNEEIKTICRDNPDITILMHVRKPPAPEPDIPYNIPEHSIQEVFERISPQKLKELQALRVEGILKGLVAEIGQLMHEAGVNGAYLDVPHDSPVMSSWEWPEFHTRIHVRRVGSKYKFELTGEWNLEARETN